MFWLSDGEEIMTLAFFVLIQYRSVTDRRMDGQTDIPPLAIPAVCIARYAKALVKIIVIQSNPHVVGLFVQSVLCRLSHTVTLYPAIAIICDQGLGLH